MGKAAGWRPATVTLTGPPIKTSTLPTPCATDAGDAYLKAVWTPGTGELLIREFIGLRLAAAMGLDAPACAIHALKGSELPRDDSGAYCREGPALLIEAIDWRIWTGQARQLELLSNREDVAGLVVLDTVLRNADRYPPVGGGAAVSVLEGGSIENVALSAIPSRRRFRLRAVDFSHGLHPGLSLDPGKLQEGVDDLAIYGLFPEFARQIRRADVDAAVERLGDLSAGLVRGIIGEIPASWWGMHGEMPDVVCDFLTGRIDVGRSRIGDLLWSRVERATR